MDRYREGHWLRSRIVIPLQRSGLGDFCPFDDGTTKIRRGFNKSLIEHWPRINDQSRMWTNEGNSCGQVSRRLVAEVGCSRDDTVHARQPMELK